MRIRVLREAGGLGDAVRVTVVMRALRERYPEAEIWAYIARDYTPIIARGGGYDRLIPTPMSPRRARGAPPDADALPVYRTPNGETFDLTVDLYDPAFTHEARAGHDQWDCRIDLWCRAAGIEPADRRPRLSLTDDDHRGAEEVLRHIVTPRADRRLIAIQPFSTDPARDWPADRFRALADVLAWRGHDVLILDGCEGRTRDFAQPRIISPPLPVLAAVMARCDLLIGPDSGLYHLAAAVDTPAVGIFASQSAGITGRHYPRHTWVSPAGEDVCPAGGRWPCFWRRPAGCTRDALRKAGRTCPALATITVEEVYDAAVAWLQRPALGIAPQPAPPADAFRGADGFVYTGGRVIPAPDRSQDSILLAAPLTDATFREAFRVLNLGGVLHIAAPVPPPSLPGMTRVAATRTAAAGCNISTWTRIATWPRR